MLSIRMPNGSDLALGSNPHAANAPTDVTRAARAYQRRPIPRFGSSRRSHAGRVSAAGSRSKRKATGLGAAAAPWGLVGAVCARVGRSMTEETWLKVDVLSFTCDPVSKTRRPNPGSCLGSAFKASFK